MTTIALATLALLAVAAPIMRRLNHRLATALIAAAPIALGCWFATLLPDVAAGRVVTTAWQWVPDLSATLSFRIDGLSLLFALLILFIGGLVLLYSSSYFEGDARLARFESTLLMFMAAMLGLVAADNLIVLFVFWELTSITSFLLISFDHERQAARKAALQALLVTALGGLALLAGSILLGVAAGSFEISDVLRADVRSHPLFPAAAALLLAGALTKSAIFPFHFWLPNAMEAPSPVSALLHSATMVKAGVYLVARLNPAMTGAPIWDGALVILGGATMLLAAFIAVRQSQFKKILAYSTVSSLGTLMMLYGLGATKAAAVYLLAHAMFKGSLFLLAGSITGQTGEKDPEALSRLHRAMPLTAATAALAALSMAGMFPLFGFVAKELILKASLAHSHWALPATAASALAALLTVAAALIVGLRPMLGASPPPPAREPSWRQSLGPFVLAAAGLAAGLAPWLFAEPMVSAMVAATDAAPPKPAHLRPLEMLYPPTLATGLSVAALAGGALCFAGLARFRRATEFTRALEVVGPARLYERGLELMFACARLHTATLQNGSLQRYVRITLLAAIAAIGTALLRAFDAASFDTSTTDVQATDALFLAAMILGGAACTLQRTALASVAVLGGVGLMIALFFALFGAPDLALTQLAVETLIVIIFVLVIFHLPRYGRLSSRRRLMSDAGIAASLGALIGVLTLAASSATPPEPISDFYAERSVPEGFGRNVVNVILVDFRAMDTLGEIFVIGVAAIGVYTLLTLRTPKRREDER